MNRTILGFSGAAITIAAMLVTVGSGVVLAQVVASATGSGQFHEFPGPNGYRTFTFSAQTDSSGITTGVTQGFSRSVPLSWQGTLNCLDVEGNVATMSGVVTDVIPNPNALGILPGFFLVFQVIDNGEGKNSPPDLISLTFFEATPPFPCLQSVDGIFATTPIENGNVQVHK